MSPTSTRYEQALVIRDQVLHHLRDQISEMLQPPKPLVLVVEDDQDSAEVTGFALSQGLYGRNPPVEVKVCTDAGEALKAAGSRPWSVAVLDMHLGIGRITGLDVLKALPHSARVVLVSGTVPEDLPAITQRTRADAWRTKPYDLDELVALVSQLLSC